MENDNSWSPFDKEKYDFLRKELKGRIENNLSGFLRCCIVGALVLLQILVLLALPFFFQKYTVYFYTIVEFLSFFPDSGTD